MNQHIHIIINMSEHNNINIHMKIHMHIHINTNININKHTHIYICISPNLLVHAQCLHARHPTIRNIFMCAYVYSLFLKCVCVCTVYVHSTSNSQHALNYDTPIDILIYCVGKTRKRFRLNRPDPIQATHDSATEQFASHII